MKRQRIQFIPPSVMRAAVNQLMSGGSSSSSTSAALAPDNKNTHIKPLAVRDTLDARTVYIEGVDPLTSSDQLKQYLNRLLPDCTIEQVDMPTYPSNHPISRTHQHDDQPVSAGKGFAFVMVDSVEAVERLLSKYLEHQEQQQEPAEKILKTEIEPSVVMSTAKVMPKSQWSAAKEKFLRMQRKGEYDSRVTLGII